MTSVSRFGTFTMLVTTLVGALASSAPALAAPSATVDWQRRVIVARGQGAPDLTASSAAAARIGAERAAQVDAFRNILETLKGVEVRGGQTAGQLMAQDSVLKASVEGLVRNFKVTDRKNFADGGVELTVEMAMDGKLAEMLLPPNSVPTRTAQGTHDVGSGLVVMAKGLKITPALAPRILDETGKEVYGPDFVQPGALRENGIAGYLTSESAAEHSARVGDHPMTVKAVKVHGSDVVISSADAAKLSDAQANLGFLSEGKVIIVTD
jgi:hypothetical protein